MFSVTDIVQGFVSATFIYILSSFLQINLHSLILIIFVLFVLYYKDELIMVFKITLCNLINKCSQNKKCCRVNNRRCRSNSTSTTRSHSSGTESDTDSESFSDTETDN